MNFEKRFKIGRLVTSRENIDFTKLMNKLSLILRDNSITIDYFIVPGGFWNIPLILKVYNNIRIQGIDI